MATDWCFNAEFSVLQNWLNYLAQDIFAINRKKKVNNVSDLFATTAQLSADEFHQLCLLDASITEKIKKRCMTLLHYAQHHAQTADEPGTMPKLEPLLAFIDAQTDLRTLWIRYLEPINQFFYEQDLEKERLNIDVILDKIPPHLRDKPELYWEQRKLFLDACLQGIATRIITMLAESMTQTEHRANMSYLSAIFAPLITAVVSHQVIELLPVLHAYLQKNQLKTDNLFKDLPIFCQEKNIVLPEILGKKAATDLLNIYLQLNEVADIFCNLIDKRYQLAHKNTDLLDQAIMAVKKNIELMDPKLRMRHWFSSEIAPIDFFFYQVNLATQQLNIDLLVDSWWPNRVNNFQDRQTKRLQLRNAYLKEVLQKLLIDVINLAHNTEAQQYLFVNYMEIVVDLLLALPLVGDLHVRHNSPLLVKTAGQQTVIDDVLTLTVKNLIENFKIFNGYSALYLPQITGTDQTGRLLLPAGKKAIQQFIDYLYSANKFGEFNLYAAYNQAVPIPDGWYNFEHHRRHGCKKFTEKTLELFIKNLTIADHKVELTADQVIDQALITDHLCNQLKQYAGDYTVQKFLPYANTNQQTKQGLLAELTDIYRTALEDESMRKINAKFFVLDQVAARVKRYIGVFYTYPAAHSPAEYTCLKLAIADTVHIEVEQAASTLKDHLTLANSFVTAYKKLRFRLQKVLDKFLSQEDTVARLGSGPTTKDQTR